MGAAPISPCVLCRIQIPGTRRGGETPSSGSQVQPCPPGQSWWMFLHTGLVPAHHSKHCCPDNTLPERQGPVLSMGGAGTAFSLPSLGLGFQPERLGWAGLDTPRNWCCCPQKPKLRALYPDQPLPGLWDMQTTLRLSGDSEDIFSWTQSFLGTSVKAVCHILCPRSASGKDWASLREEVDPTIHDLWTVGLEKAGSWLTPRPYEYLTLHNGVRMVGHLLQVGQQPCQRSRQRSPGVGDYHSVRVKGSDLEVAVGMWSFMYQQEIRATRGSGGHKP